MRKALPITIIFLLLTLSMTPLATAQKQNIITNETTETLYVISSTKFGAEDDIPAGYRTSGWKTIAAGQQRAFWAYDPHKIYFQIWKSGKPIKPEVSTQTFAFWINRDAKFDIVTRQEINASITRAELLYSSHGTNPLTHRDGFIRYNNGSQITVTNAWVDVPDWKRVETLRAHTAAVNALAWHPTDGQRLASGSSDKVVRVWHFSEINTSVPLVGHTGAVLGVAWNPDGKELHSAGSDGTIRAWDPRTGFIEIKLKKDHPIVAISLKGSFRFYTTEPEETSVDLSWDTKHAVAGLTDNTIQVFSTKPIDHLRTLEGHTGSVNAVAWSPDDTRIVNGSADRTVRVWDPETGTLLKTLRGHTGAVNAVAWSPDGTRVVSGSDDRTVRVWDPETGTLLKTLRGHTGSVNTVAWSPDGTRIASGSADNTILMWEKPDDAEMSEAEPLEETVDPNALVNIPDPELRAAITEALSKAQGDTITAADMQKLTRLFAGVQGIHDLTGLEFATNLTWLGLNYNQITDVSPLTGLKNLTHLYLNNNEITDVSPLTGLKNLTELGLRNNQITDVSPLAGLKNLTWLVLSGNQITDVSPLAGLTNLTRLELNNNQITDVSPLAGLTNLTRLWLSNNAISDFSPIAGLIPNLEYYSNNNQKIVDPNTPVNIPDPDLRAVIEEALGKTQGATITRAEMATLTSLDATNKRIQDLTGLEFATNLTWLHIQDNQITDISPLAGLTSLETLDISHHQQIKDYSPLLGLTSLTWLSLHNNQISDLSPLSGLTNLTGLHLRNNQISDLSPLSGLTNLTGLHLRNNQISDLSPLSGLTNLTGLHLRNNQISDLSPLSGLTNLTGLHLRNNQISDLSPLSGLTNLTTLDLSNNQISDLSPLSGLTNLRELRLSNNQISDLSPLSGLTNLRELRLSNNQISDLSPLSGLTNLTTLNISRNQIKDYSPLLLLPSLYTVKADDGIYDITTLWSAVGHGHDGCHFEMPQTYGSLDPSVHTYTITAKQHDGGVSGNQATIKSAPIVDDNGTLNWTYETTVASESESDLTTITVKFLNGHENSNRDEINRVKAAAKLWENEGYLKFKFLEPNEPGASDIRVRFDYKYFHEYTKSVIKTKDKLKVETTPTGKTFSVAEYQTYKAPSVDHVLLEYQSFWSSYGTKANDYKNDATMHFTANFKRGTALHEFGHALGLTHEHLSPKFNNYFQWIDKEEVRRYYMEKNGWTRETVDFNVLDIVSIADELPGVDFDHESIMTYSIPAHLIKARPNAPQWAQDSAENGIKRRNELSEGDKAIMKTLYPEPIPIHIKAKIKVHAKDDDFGSDEYFDNRNNPAHVEALHIHRAPLGKYLYSVGQRYWDWGSKECRVEVHLSVRNVDEKRGAEIGVYALLYEGGNGSSRDTDDLEDIECETLRIPLGSTETVILDRLFNRGVYGNSNLAMRVVLDFMSMMSFILEMRQAVAIGRMLALKLGYGL